MAKHQGGRGRAKRRRRVFVVGKGMRKCPRAVSNLSEGGQATFSRRGKARQRRSSRGRARRQLHRPVRADAYEGGRKERKRNIERGAWLWRIISHFLPLSYDPPSLKRKKKTYYTPPSLHIHKLVLNNPPPPPPPPRLRGSAGAGAV